MPRCPKCRTPNRVGAEFCKGCGAEIGETSRSSSGRGGRPAEHAGEGERLDRLHAAGALAVIGGVAGFLAGPLVPPLVSEYVGDSPLSVLTSNPSSLASVLSLLCVVGGLLALLQRAFAVSVALLLLGSFAVGPFFATSALGIAATVLVARSRRDFIPILTRPGEPPASCPDCGHPAEFEGVYREWYCYNCRSRKKLPRREASEAGGSPDRAGPTSSRGTDDGTDDP